MITIKCKSNLDEQLLMSELKKRVAIESIEILNEENSIKPNDLYKVNTPKTKVVDGEDEGPFTADSGGGGRHIPSGYILKVKKVTANKVIFTIPKEEKIDIKETGEISDWTSTLKDFKEYCVKN